MKYLKIKEEKKNNNTCTAARYVNKLLKRKYEFVLCALLKDT